MSGVIFKESQKVPYGIKTTRFSLKLITSVSRFPHDVSVISCYIFSYFYFRSLFGVERDKHFLLICKALFSDDLSAPSGGILKLVNKYSGTFTS